MFDEQFNSAFAILFCREVLVGLYKKLMWKLYEGKVFVDQPEGKIEFTVNELMVLDVKEKAPLNGVIDLNGLPW